MGNMEQLMAINRKMMMAGSDKEYDDDKNYERKETRYEGKGKYRKIFATPTSYKDFEKDVVKDCLEKELPSILRDFEESYKSGDYSEPLRYVLGNKRFIKTLKKNIEKFEDTSLITLMLSEQLLKNRFVCSDEEIKTSYEEVFFCIMAKKFQKFMEKFELDEKVAKELFINVCNYDKIRPAHIHQRVLNVLAVLYNRVDKCKDPIEIFKRIFRDYQFDALIGILLESRANQNCLTPEAKEIWSKFTNFALDDIESMDKDDIKRFLNIFIKCLKSLQKHGEHLPRISLLNNISGDFEKINKAVRKLIEDDESNKKYFM
jgi:hypothetical protein